ncbi:leucine-rich repeat domain-containing protein [Candidatus Uabimicrobium sp. HlEnr_7]|uniref:leucine-rich repeat domain-containing protein n=1 Tax=Candidatus Uabimicrobium helgolandensis TaxID=3095367 RepID=UPI003559366D
MNRKKIAQRRSLQNVVKNTHYQGCTFYLEHPIVDIENVIFENCSFRTAKVRFRNLKKTKFKNCNINTLVLKEFNEIELEAGYIDDLDLELKPTSPPLLCGKVTFSQNIRIKKIRWQNASPFIDDVINNIHIPSLVSLHYVVFFHVENEIDNRILSMYPSLKNGDELKLSHLHALTTLGLTDYALSKIPNLPKSMTKINLSHNSICEKHCNSLSMLDCLSKLNLSYNAFENFPLALINLKNLETLDLSHNRLSSIPSQISQLSKLRYLNLSANSLSSVAKKNIAIWLPNCSKIDL